MNALDKLAQKGNFTAIESVIYTYAMLEREGRGDGLNIASEKAANELAQLQARIVELEKAIHSYVYAKTNEADSLAFKQLRRLADGLGRLDK